MTFKKISAALALLLASTAFTACGPDENNDTTEECAAGQKKAKIGTDGEARCYTTCETVADCGGSEQCLGSGDAKFCVGSTTPEKDMEPDDKDMGTDEPDMPVVIPDMPVVIPDMPVVIPDMPVDNDMADMTVGDPPNPGAACADASACTGMGATCLPDPDLPGGYCTSLCQGDANCGTENVCLQTANGGTCVDGCATDADCRVGEGYTCQDADGKNACLPAPPEYIIGIECADNTACGDGVCASEMDGFTGGYCVGACGVDSDCPTNAQCVSGFGEMQDASLCLSACTSAADCRADYTCADLDANGVGECWPTNSMGVTPGGACTPPDMQGMNGTECQGLNAGCVAEDGDMDGVVDFPGGLCIAACELGNACPADAHCLPDTFGENGPLCLSDCVADTDCRDGYTCQDLDNDMVTECWLAPVSADGPGVPGAACTDAATDCAGGVDGFCIPEDTDGDGIADFPGGYCTVNCLNDPANCTQGESTCVALGMNNDQAVCLDDCSVADACRAGYVCLNLMTGAAVMGQETGVCFIQ